MARIADRYDYVIGVDTHARSHTFIIIESRTGAVIDTLEFPTHAAGMTRALTWIQRRAEGSTFAAVEGTSSYGAKLTTVFIQAGIPVGEVRPPSRKQQAVDGKSDRIDAEIAARSVLGQDESRVAVPRSSAERNALRILLATRRLLDQQRTACRNALTALLRTVDLGVDARRAVSDAQITAIKTWRTTDNDPVVKIARTEARRLARAIADHDKQLRDNHSTLNEIVERIAPGLQDTPGIGPVTGAVIVCAYSHHGRIRSEAAFAALAGVAPNLPRRETPCATGSIAVVTANSTARSRPSCAFASATTPTLGPTLRAPAQPANQPAKSAANSSVTSAAPSSGNSKQSWPALDTRHRRVILG